MSLRPQQPIPPVPDDTARVARAAFRTRNPYLILRDRLGALFGIFAALAEFERELAIERARASLASAHARARGRNGGRPFKMTAPKLRLAQAAMGQPGTKVAELCAELGVSRQTLYRRVDPNGGLRPDRRKLLGRKGSAPAPDGARVEAQATGAHRGPT